MISDRCIFVFVFVKTIWLSEKRGDFAEYKFMNEKICYMFCDQSRKVKIIKKSKKKRKKTIIESNKTITKQTACVQCASFVVPSSTNVCSLCAEFSVCELSLKLPLLPFSSEIERIERERKRRKVARPLGAASNNNNNNEKILMDKVFASWKGNRRE